MKKSTLLILSTIVLSNFLLLSLPAGAQQGFDYEQAWEEADSLILEGLPKSALGNIQLIYERARKEQNTAMLIKAVLHRTRLQLHFEEDAFVKNIADLKADIRTAVYPARPVLHSLLAESYWDYYQRNRYQFFNRTEVSNPKSDDFKTWDYRRLLEEVIRQHSLALAAEEELQTTSIAILEGVLEGDSSNRFLRPTLYDFIAHRAAALFLEEESNLSPRPEEDLLFNDPGLFADAGRFAQMTFDSLDSLSLRVNGLVLLQELTRFHLNDRDPSALVMVELQRLAYAYKENFSSNRGAAYYAALQSLRERYDDFPISSEIAYSLADALANKEISAGSEDPDSTKYIKALKICQEAIDAYPESEGAQNCRALVSRMQEKELGVKSEDINYPGEPLRLLVSYRNLPEIHLRVIKLTSSELDSLRKNSGEGLMADRKRILDLLGSKEVLQEVHQALPGIQDHYEHRLELAIKPLRVGHYALLTSDSKDPGDKGDLLTFNTFQVSALGAFYRSRGLSQELYISDRKSGDPLPGVNILVYEHISRNFKENRKKVIRLDRSLVTDKEGHSSFRLSEKKSYSIFAGRGTDTLEVAAQHWAQPERPRARPDIRKQSMFFTDRRLYRPGQSVHFKGLIFKKTETGTQLLTGDSGGLSFAGPQGEEIAKQQYRSNEFGTFSGTFILPDNALPGRYHIRNASGSTWIEVAEYKRPTFEVRFEPVTALYRLGDSVLIDGSAMSLAGYPIDDAQVIYTVTRQEIYRPMPYRSFHPWRLKPLQIASGQVETAQDGSFQICFPAEAADTSQSFQYVIVADVTDAAGETHSAQSSVKVGNDNLKVQLPIGSTIRRSDSLRYTISATSLNGAPQKAGIEVRVKPLMAPENVLRDRLWESPDQFILSKAAYKALFPHDPYRDEDNPHNWPAGDPVMEKHLKLDSTGILSLEELKSEAPGYYLAEVQAETPTGEKASESYYFQLTSNEPGIPQTRDHFIRTIKGSGAPGEELEYLVGSGEPGLILQESSLHGELIERRWIETGDRQQLVRVKIPEDAPARGLAVEFTLIRENRIYHNFNPIMVEMPEKKLDIEFLSFRDKARPGEEEKWSIRVSANGEGVLAEMVATLYDASLDRIQKLYWPTYRLGGHVYSPNAFHPWNVRSFTGQNSERHLKHTTPLEGFIFRSYEHLNQLGYQSYLRQLERKRKIKKANAEAEAAFKEQSAAIKEGSIIQGIVTDRQGEPLPGVSIQIKGMESGVTSSLDGSYKIKVPPGGILTFSFIGFQSQEIRPGKDHQLDIRLIQDGSALEEVVVVGYGARQKQSLTGRVVARSAAPAAEASADIMIRGTGNAKPESEQAGENGDETGGQNGQLTELVPRKNFNETAFFYPQLYSDEEGKISLEFTLPESITRWRMLGFAHSKDAKFGSIEKELVTTKEVSVTANAPRFLRSGDRISFTAKVVNMTTERFKGKVQLVLLDALSLEPIDTLIQDEATKEFRLDGASSKAVSWDLAIPEGLEALTYRVLASAGNYTDGEEKTIPVLPARILITETLPLQVDAGESADFSISDFKGYQLPSARPYRFTFEFTSNPAWYALQSLPYLMEYPYECAEQLYSRYYASSVAASIMNKAPRIQAVFSQWKNAGGEALVSRLEKDQELKSALLEETPWVLQAQKESERQQRLGLLFDLNHLQQQGAATLRKLADMQLPNGSFPWFRGMNGNRFITQYLLEGIGKLRHMNALPEKDREKLMEIARKALEYSDQQFAENYQALLKASEGELDDQDHLDPFIIHFMYMRSFFPEVKADQATTEALSYYREQAGRYWQGQQVYQQGMLALVLQRSEKPDAAAKIIRSLLERAQDSPKKGLYWSGNQLGYTWYQAPIETQALLIEAFSEISPEHRRPVEQMKKWLLLNKRTNSWQSTKATVAACYALLMRGDDWLSGDEQARISFGGTPLEALKPDLKKEAATGYLKTSWEAENIGKEMEAIRITNPGKVSSWGAMYWQYFEQPENVPASGEGLLIVKNLYKREMTEAGPLFRPIEESERLKAGDLIKVRMELSADRDYEYVHLKDLRAAGLEPVDMLASYRYQDGLGYYMAPRDASMNFFIGRLRKGTYVLEYEVRVAHSGEFSNGFAQVQCMYAPEFSARSEGGRLEIPEPASGQD